MSKRSALAFALLLLPLVAFCQEDAKTLVGFSFVNAVDSQSPTFVKLNDASYRPSGYPVGAITDGGMLYAGPYTMEISNAELKSFSLAIKADETQSVVYVAYGINEEKPDGTVERKLACLTLSNLPKSAGKNTFYAIYASAFGQARILVDGVESTLEAGKLVKISDKGSCKIEVDGKKRTISPEDGGNFIVVVYRSGEKTGFSVIKSSKIVERRAE